MEKISIAPLISLFSVMPSSSTNTIPLFLSVVPCHLRFSPFLSFSPCSSSSCVHVRPCISRRRSSALSFIFFCLPYSPYLIPSPRHDPLYSHLQESHLDGRKFIQSMMLATDHPKKHLKKMMNTLIMTLTHSKEEEE